MAEMRYYRNDAPWERAPTEVKTIRLGDWIDAELAKLEGDGGAMIGYRMALRIMRTEFGPDARIIVE